MQIELTNSNIELFYSLNESLSHVDTKLWFEIDENILNLKPIVDKIHDSKKIIIEKYADKDKEGQYIMPQPNAYSFTKNMVKVTKLLDSLMNQKETIELHTLPLSELKKMELRASLIRPLKEASLII